ncbi:helix-turn-helix domain-containing protein [Methyloceanibacter sp.]|uniref:helix-turn-helix domain-containing protein n=1 Tax=Methyloceanibacter sp. TaxID=1965321 RepID=UPI002D37BE28|nr:helix-turn-helix domain-containing protein [Methyloceanibacter sp.]HZP10440.1 helix-turn-helix domain-containing protein [Methyloceanibacter sp.]
MAELRTVEQRLARQAYAATKRGRATHAPARYILDAPPADLRQAIDPAVAAVFAVKIGDLRSPTRSSPRAAFARQVAMYLAHVVCGQSLTAVGTLFQRDRTTVAHACRLIEDARDDPGLDRLIEHLECAVASLIDAFGSRCGLRQ